MERHLPSTIPSKIIMLETPIQVLNRMNVAAWEEAYVDLSLQIPYARARHALILASLSPSGLIQANLLQVGHGIYDNLVGYNVWGNINLLKPAGIATCVAEPWVHYLVKITDRKYAYDISGAFNGNTVNIWHYLLGYVL